MIETVGRADMVIMKKKIVQVNSPRKPLELKILTPFYKPFLCLWCRGLPSTNTAVQIRKTTNQAIATVALVD